MNKRPLSVNDSSTHIFLKKIKDIAKKRPLSYFFVNGRFWLKIAKKRPLSLPLSLVNATISLIKQPLSLPLSLVNANHMRRYLGIIIIC